MSDLETKFKELMALVGDNTELMHKTLDDAKLEYLALQQYNKHYQQRVDFLYQRFQEKYPEVSPDQSKLTQLLKDLLFTQSNCDETLVGRATFYEHKTHSRIGKWTIYHAKLYMEDKTCCDPYDYETEIEVSVDNKYIGDLEESVQSISDHYGLAQTTNTQLCVLIENATIGNYNDEYIYHGSLMYDYIFEYKVAFFDDEWPWQSDFDAQSEPQTKIPTKESKAKVPLKLKSKPKE